MGFFCGERAGKKMKKALTLFVILAQILAPQLCFAAGSFNESFQLSVTIPAVIGLNVPDPNAPVQSMNTPVSLKDLVNSNTETQLIELATVRNHQNIMLRTLVVR
jgi:hypothetical protein